MKQRSEKKNYRRTIVFAHILTLVICCALIIAYGADTTYKKEQETRSQLVAAENLQIIGGANAFLKKLEDTGKIFFTRNDYIKHGSSGFYDDQYDSLQIESEMTDFLITLSLMDNFSDFGVIYSDNHSVGKMSSGTLDLYKGETFELLTQELGQNKTCWTAGFNGDFKRIYYLHAVNDNAIFVASFYTYEFSGIFLRPEQLGNITVILIDDEGNIICSSGKDGEPEKYVDNYTDSYTNDGNFTIIDDNYIESANTLDCGWTVMTCLDLSDQILLRRRIVMVCIGIAIAGIISIIISCTMIFSQEDHGKFGAVPHKKASAFDKLTGLSNAETTESLIADKIDTCITGSTILMALITIRNYKLIYENYGAAGANESLLAVAKALNDQFGESDIVGRTGDNEFAVFVDFTEYDLFKAHSRLKDSLAALDERLRECELSDNRGMIKCAVGAVVYPDVGNDYDDLYECAKRSLAEAVKNDNGKYVLYKKEEIRKGVRRT